MLENLNHGQFIAVAIISHVYYHDDPMALVLNGTDVDDLNSASVSFWVNTFESRITCIKPNDSFSSLNKKPIIFLGEVPIPLGVIAKSVNLSMPSGRITFVSSVIGHLIHHQWGTSPDFEAIGLDDVTLKGIRDDLSSPKVTKNGVECLSTVLSDVITPCLKSGFSDSSMVH